MNLPKKCAFLSYEDASAYMAGDESKAVYELNPDGSINPQFEKCIVDLEWHVSPWVYKKPPTEKPFNE